MQSDILDDFAPTYASTLMDHLKLPFAKYPLVRAQGIDAAHSEFNRLYKTATVNIPGRTKMFTWHANGVSLGSMLIVAGLIDNAVEISMQPTGNAVVLYASRSGQARLQCAKKEYSVGNGTGVIMAPTQANKLLVPTDFASLTVRMDSTILEETFQAIAGVESAKSLEFETVFDARTPQGAELARLLEFLMQTLEQDQSPLAHPLVLSHLQNAFLTAFLLNQPHNQRHLLEQDAPKPSTRAVKTVEAYLDAHADKPISMAELQAVSGMSVRSIQAGFKTNRGLSPMAFLKERRLLMAQQRLQLATPSTQVTEVAFSCGFAHLGRFSRDYFKRFGEKPSETLERALLKNGVLVKPTDSN